MIRDGATRAEALRFVGVGALAAAVNFGSRIVLSLVVPFVSAVTLAFFVGLATAFVLNRNWVFRRRTRAAWRIEAARFTIVNLAGLPLTVIVSVWLATRLLPALGVQNGREALAHLCGIGATVVSSYLAHKWWSFRQ